MDGIGAEPTFPVTVLSLLCEELDATGGAWQRVDWRTGDSELFLYGLPQVSVPTLLQATRSLRHTHPLLVACARGELAPMTAEHAAGGRSAWQRSPCRQFLSTLVEAPQMVSVGLRGGGAEVCGLAFARSGADFTPAALSFLAEVQPVLQAVDRHVTRLSRWSDASPAGAAEVAAHIGLTSREVEVLGLVAEGLTAAAASRRLGCSTRTVHKHVGHLFQKLQVHDRLGAVLEAQRLGLIRCPAPRLGSRANATGPARRGVESFWPWRPSGPDRGGAASSTPEVLVDRARGVVPRVGNARSPA
jgi:DNA-binding CsgD family transcriptional regulator